MPLEGIILVEQGRTLLMDENRAIIRGNMGLDIVALECGFTFLYADFLLFLLKQVFLPAMREYLVRTFVE